LRRVELLLLLLLDARHVAVDHARFSQLTEENLADVLLRYFRPPCCDLTSDERVARRRQRSATTRD
jgi:hypothetical protein